jgi:type I restriction enzyme S subunit
METGVHYPLRLDALPRGWRAGYVGDFAQEIEPGFASGEHNQTGEGVAHLRPMNVDREGKIDLSVTKFVSANKDGRRLAVGDVLFNNTNSPELVGKTAAVNVAGDFAFSNHMTRIHFADDVLPKFGALQLHFIWMRGYFKYNCVKHVNQASVSSRALARGVPFVWAPLPEQERIVAEVEKQFSRLDEAVANLKRSTANLLAYKQAAVRKAIWGDRSVAASVEDLPPGWSLTALSELGELRRGKSKHRPRDDPKLYGGPYPFIQTGDVRRSAGVIREYTQTYSEFGLQQSRLWPAGTLCITIAANIAETGILAAPACFPDSVVGFVSADGTLVRYVELFFRTIRADLERFAPATAQKNINLSILERVQVPLPPASDRERIVAEVDRRLSIVREVEVQVEATQRRAASLKSSCLAASFSAARKREAPDQLEKREEASD